MNSFILSYITTPVEIQESSRNICSDKHFNSQFGWDSSQ